MKILSRKNEDLGICPQCKKRITDDGNGQLDDHIRWHDRQ